MFRTSFQKNETCTSALWISRRSGKRRRFGWRPWFGHPARDTVGSRTSARDRQVSFSVLCSHGVVHVGDGLLRLPKLTADLDARLVCRTDASPVTFHRYALTAHGEIDGVRARCRSSMDRAGCRDT